MASPLRALPGAADEIPVREIPAPLLAPALGFIAGIVAAESGFSIPGSAGVTALMAAAVLAVGRCLRTGRCGIAMVCVALVAALAGAVRYQAAIRLPADDVSHSLGAEDQLVRVAGVVLTRPRTRPVEVRNPYIPAAPRPRTDFVIELTGTGAGAGAAPLRGLVQVYVDGDGVDVAPGDEVEVTGWINRIRGPRNPGEPDWSAVAARSGVRARMSVDSAALVRKVGRSRAWLGMYADLRAGVRASLLGTLPPDAESASRLLDALVLGQRSAVERRVDEAFTRVGAVHFLSVSGFHVGVLGLVTFWFVRYVARRGRRTTAVVTAAALIAYGLLAEPNSPIVRSVAMGVLACAGVLIGRQRALLNWLSLALIGVLAWNPLELFSAGFQLSFLLVCGLLTVVACFQRFFNRVRGDAPRDADTWRQFVIRKCTRWLSALVITNVVCWLLAAPLVMHHFGLFTPYSALQLVPLTPYVALLTILGFVTLIAGAVWPWAGELLGRVLAEATDGLTAAVDWFAGMPGGVIECTPPPAWFVWSTYGGLAVVWLLWRRPVGQRAPATRVRFTHRRAAAVAVGVAVALAWIGWAVLPVVRPPGVRLDVLAVGNGSAALLTTREGGAAVFDCGSMQNIDTGSMMAAAARAEGVRSFDLVAVSHANFDHFSGVPRLLARYRVARFASHPTFVGDGRRSVATRRFLAAVGSNAPGRLSAGDELTVGGARLSVLWPPARPGEGWDENDRSIVFRVEYAGRRILVPGDASQVALAELARLHAAGEIDLRADVLLAPHHGAVVAASRTFYGAVGADWVVVSAQRARRPIEELIRGVLGGDVRVFVTGEEGCVRIEIDRGGITQVSAPFAGD